MVFNINDIRGALPLGGARPTLFSVQFVNPSSSVADIKVPFLCEAASLPDSRLGVIQVPYFGRTIKLAGDRTFNPWTVTIMNDEDFAIKNALETWSNAINSMQGNLRGFGTSASAAYKTNALVRQYGKTGQTLREYTFNGIYPAEISQIELNWGSTDSIERFSIGFQYDFWYVSGGMTGTGGGL